MQSSSTIKAYQNPMIISERKMNAVPIDVFSRLLMDRIIFLGDEINDEVSNIIQAQFLYLASLDDESPISLYINSPGGSVTAGLAIYDTMQFIEPKVRTICTGRAASMAAVLLAAGDERYALPHSSIMIHEPSMGLYPEKCTDLLINAKQLEKDKDILASILAKHTGKSIEVIKEDFSRDKWFSSTEAVEYGIIDAVKASS